MQATETQLLTLLAGQHQFAIPIFQRDYSWGGDECERLVNDVLAVADGPDGAMIAFATLHLQHSQPSPLDRCRKASGSPFLQLRTTAWNHT